MTILSVIFNYEVEKMGRDKPDGGRIHTAE